MGFDNADFIQSPPATMNVVTLAASDMRGVTPRKKASIPSVR
jgi:hypothetical protein